MYINKQFDSLSEGISLYQKAFKTANIINNNLNYPMYSPRIDFLNKNVSIQSYFDSHRPIKSVKPSKFLSSFSKSW